MTSDPADADLHAQFRALRDHDAATLPELDLVLARASARSGRSRPTAVPMRAWAAGGGVAALAVIAMAAWLAVRPAPPPATLDRLALPGWRTPTDSLLAGLGDPVQGSSSWAVLPTAGLGQPAFNRPGEKR